MASGKTKRRSSVTPDFSSHPKFHEGWVDHKTVLDAWKSFWLVLQGRYLLFLDSQRTSLDQCKGKIELFEGVVLTSDSSHKTNGYKFQLNTGKKHPVKFKCCDENERDLWVAYIDGIANGFFENSTKLSPEQSASVDAAVKTWTMIQSRARLSSASSSLDEGIVSNYSGDDSQGGPIKNHKFYLDVPGSQRQQTVPSWFFENCSRQLAERVLEKGREFGNVLMRESVTFKDNGSYVISLRRDTPRGQQYEHFEVMRVAAGYQVNVENRNSPKRCLQDVMDFFVDTAGHTYTRPLVTNDLTTIGIVWPYYQSVIQSVGPEEASREQRAAQQSKPRNLSQTMSAGSSGNPFRGRPCKDVAVAPMSLREVHRCRSGLDNVDGYPGDNTPASLNSDRFTPSAPAEPPNRGNQHSQSQFELELAGKLKRRQSAGNVEEDVSSRTPFQRVPSSTSSQNDNFRPLPQTPTVPQVTPQHPTPPVVAAPPVPKYSQVLSSNSAALTSSKIPPPTGPRPLSLGPQAPTSPVGPPSSAIPAAPPPPTIPQAPPPPAFPTAPPPPPVAAAPTPTSPLKQNRFTTNKQSVTFDSNPPKSPALTVLKPHSNPQVQFPPPTPSSQVKPQTQPKKMPKTLPKPSRRSSESDLPPPPPYMRYASAVGNSEIVEEEHPPVRDIKAFFDKGSSNTSTPNDIGQSKQSTRRASEHGDSRDYLTASSLSEAAYYNTPSSHVGTNRQPKIASIHRVSKQNHPTMEYTAVPQTVHDEESIYEDLGLYENIGKGSRNGNKRTFTAVPEPPPEVLQPPPPPTHAPPALHDRTNTDENQAMSTSEGREEFKRRLEVLMGGTTAGVASPVSPPPVSAQSLQTLNAAQPVSAQTHSYPTAQNLDENIYSEPVN